jgi:hypothetical protein
MTTTTTTTTTVIRLINIGLVFILIWLIWLKNSAVVATQYDLYPNNTEWRSVVQNLVAGDVVIFHAGEYKVGGSFFEVTLQGTANEAIVLRSAVGEGRPIIHNTPGPNAQNIMNIIGSYFVIDGIGFVGGSRGIRLGGRGGAVNNSVFNNLLIANTTGTAFSANDGGNDYFNLTITNNEIYNTNYMSSTTGECFYLGCDGDVCRIHDSIVEHNYCHDTLGSTSGSRAAIQIKTGSYNNLISKNVCYNVVGPCVLVYDDYDRGRNIIDGNVAFNAGTQDLAFQATSGVTITNNIAVNASFAGIGILLNSVRPNSSIRNISILHNTVFNSLSDACLRLNNIGSTPTNIIVANNVFYCLNQPSIRSASDLSSVTFSRNAIYGTVSASGISSNGTFPLSSNLANIFQNVGNNDFYPVSGSALIGSGDSVHSISYDFNGRPRSSTTPTVGAYEYSSTTTNPGCIPNPNSFLCGSSNAPIISPPSSPSSSPSPTSSSSSPSSPSITTTTATTTTTTSPSSPIPSPLPSPSSSPSPSTTSPIRSQTSSAQYQSQIFHLFRIVSFFNLFTFLFV